MGGRTTDGSARATHEVWRYTVADDAWTSVIFTPPVPTDTLAVGFDAATEQIVTVDVDDAAHASKARLLLLDLHTRRGVELATMNRKHSFTRLALVARQNGTWVLIGSANGHHVDAFRFTLDANGVHWTGHATFHGDLIDQPANTTNGILMPVLANGQQTFVTLTDADFHDNGSNSPNGI